MTLKELFEMVKTANVIAEMNGESDYYLTISVNCVPLKKVNTQYNKNRFMYWFDLIVAVKFYWSEELLKIIETLDLWAESYNPTTYSIKNHSGYDIRITLNH